MKKTLLSAASLFFIGGAFTQINVSTETTKRAAVLEEYTGNYCTFCPDGHKIADELDALHGENLVTLKIQIGGFSGTDPIFGGTLQTPSGNAIAAPFDSNGYPNGIVNRAASGSVGRGQWAGQVNNIVSQDSPVNMYMESSVDITTRELEVSVEYFYTGDETGADNYLHIGYYQDNIPAFQYDPGFYPENFYILSEEIYKFDHAFRAMVNGNFGEVIPEKEAGSTNVVTKTITLPNSFSTFVVEPGSIKVFAFISRGQQGEIITAVKSTPEYSNFPTTNDIGVLFNSVKTDENCVGKEGSLSPTILVGTYGEANLASFDIDYGVNGGEDAHSWAGNLKHNEKIAVTLPATDFTFQLNNTLAVTVNNPNGEVDEFMNNNSRNRNFSGGPSRNADKIRIDTKTDAYAHEESSFNLYDGDGNLVLASGFLPSSTTTSFVYYVPVGTDCYKIQMLDSYGDGWDFGIAEAWLRVYNVTGGANTLMHTLSGTFGAEYNGAIELTSEGSHASLQEDYLAQSVGIYPNPAADKVYVSFENKENAEVSVSIVNMVGQEVYRDDLGVVNGAQNLEINVANYQSGLYLVKINANNVTTTKRLSVAH